MDEMDDETFPSGSSTDDSFSSFEKKFPLFHFETCPFHPLFILLNFKFCF